MTKEIRLEVEDIETGTTLRITPEADGALLELENDTASIEISLDGSHLSLLHNVIAMIEDAAAPQEPEPNLIPFPVVDDFVGFSTSCGCPCGDCQSAGSL